MDTRGNHSLTASSGPVSARWRVTAHRLKGPRGTILWCALLLPVLTLTGCRSLVPRYEQPELPVSERYPPDAGDGLAPGAVPAATAATGWRDYFADATLCTLIEQALAHNRDLRCAVLRVQEARALYGIQRAELFPSVYATADGARSRTPGDLNASGHTHTGSEYHVALASSAWEIDFWGRVRSLKQAALADYLATDAARQAATVSLIADVADGYLRLREFDERIALTRKAIATREESFRIFTRRFEVGATSQLDVTEVETLLLQAQALGTQLEQARAIEAHGLTLLVGSPVDLPPGQGSIRELNVLHPLRAGLPAELLTCRPDIVAAEHQLRRAHANVGAARAAFLPRVTLTGSLGTASAGLDGLFRSGSLAWTYGPSLSVPIFDAGRNANNLDLAEVRRNLEVAAYEKTVQNAFRDVADALSSQQWLTEQVKIQEQTLGVQTERARLAKRRYDSGSASFIEVLDAERELLSAEQQVVNTRRELLSSRVRLYAALGGGAQADVSASPVARDPSQREGI